MQTLHVVPHLATALALSWILQPSLAPAQDKEVSKAEIARALESPDSLVRNKTWRRLDAENPAHYKVLVQILGKLSWFDREGTAVALAKAHSDETIEKMVKDLLKHKDPFVRQGMAAALARMNDAKYYNRLYEALKDKNPFVRRFVVHCLRVHKKHETVDALIDLFQVEQDPVVRSFIENSLNELTKGFQGPNPAAWASWWQTAKSQKGFKLGQTDEEALKQAEELGLKLKERRTVSVSGGVTLDSSSRGSDKGIPILILPEYGMSKKVMLPFLAELEREHRLYYIDLPTIDSFKNLPKAGNTDIPYYPIDNLVEAFEDLRQETDQERFALLTCGGLSSWIAMRYVTLHPESVAANIFVAPQSSAKEFGAATDRMEGQAKSEKDDELLYVALSRKLDSQTGETFLDKYHREKKVKRPEGQGESIERRAFSLYFKNERDSTISILYPDHSRKMGAVVIPDFSLFKEKDKPPAQVPTLVIVGEGSLYNTVQDGQAIAKYYKSPCIVFKESSCFPFAEESEQFNQVVGGFLRKYTRPVKKAEAGAEDDEEAGSVAKPGRPRRTKVGGEKKPEGEAEGAKKKTKKKKSDPEDDSAADGSGDTSGDEDAGSPGKSSGKKPGAKSGKTSDEKTGKKGQKSGKKKPAAGGEEDEAAAGEGDEP